MDFFKYDFKHTCLRITIIIFFCIYDHLHSFYIISFFLYIGEKYGALNAFAIAVAVTATILFLLAVLLFVLIVYFHGGFHH